MAKLFLYLLLYRYLEGQDYPQCFMFYPSSRSDIHYFVENIDRTKFGQWPNYTFFFCYKDIQGQNYLSTYKSALSSLFNISTINESLYHVPAVFACFFFYEDLLSKIFLKRLKRPFIMTYTEGLRLDSVSWTTVLPVISILCD